MWRKENGKWVMDALRNAMPPEILFIERCVQFLKPGKGKIESFCRMACSAILTTSNIRYWIMANCQVLASVDLPVETFPGRNANQRPHTAAQVRTRETQRVFPVTPPTIPSLWRSQRRSAKIAVAISSTNATKARTDNGVTYTMPHSVNDPRLRPWSRHRAASSQTITRYCDTLGQHKAERLAHAELLRRIVRSQRYRSVPAHEVRTRSCVLMLPSIAAPRQYATSSHARPPRKTKALSDLAIVEQPTVFGKRFMQGSEQFESRSMQPAASEPLSGDGRFARRLSDQFEPTGATRTLLWSRSGSAGVTGPGAALMAGI